MASKILQTSDAFGLTKSTEKTPKDMKRQILVVDYYHLYEFAVTVLIASFLTLFVVFMCSDTWADPIKMCKNFTFN